MKQLMQDLKGWDDSVGEHIAALAVPAMAGFSDNAEQLKKETEKLEELIKKKPETSVHAIPPLEPPEEAEESPQNDTIHIQSGLPDSAGA